MLKVKGIIIEFGDEEYTLDIEQAKKLYEELKEIFDKEKEVITVPSPCPVYPTTPDPYKWPIITWCSTLTSSTEKDTK